MNEDDEGLLDLAQSKKTILEAFFELAWADGELSSVDVDFLCSMAEDLEFNLGERLALLVQGLVEPPTASVKNLASIDLDEMEKYQVVERMVALCLRKEHISPQRGQMLGQLALQLGIRAQELEEMRRRVC